MPLRKNVQAALAILIAGVTSGVAWAHPALESTQPGQGATVSPPKEVRLIFTEDLVAKFSGLTIKDESGRLVETASSSADAKQKRQIIRSSWPSQSRFLPEHTTLNGMPSRSTPTG